MSNIQFDDWVVRKAKKDGMLRSLIMGSIEFGDLALDFAYSAYNKGKRDGRNEKRTI